MRWVLLPPWCHRTALVALSLVACSGRGDGRPAPGSNTVAAVVLDVTGQVTARRDADASARPLAVDAALYADDTVVTAADAAVRIRIHHNGVVLGLGGGKELRLCDSVAWKAPRGTDPGLLDESVTDHTAVAGRPGERSAADTAATAMPGEVGAKGKAQPKGADDHVTLKASVGGTDSPEPADDFGESVAVGPTVTRFAIDPGVTFAVPVEEMVRAALAERLPGCYRALLDAVPGAGGVLSLTIEVDVAGKVVVRATSFSPILDQCAQAAVGKLPLGHAEDATQTPIATTLVVEISFVPE